MHRFLFAFLLLFAVTSARAAETIETPASHVLIMDYDTGLTLFEKNGDRPMPPASMSKLMTVEILFGKLKAGALKLDDTFLVSEKAWRMGGSKMFVEVGKQVTIEDLIRGIIVASGNDACIVVAEGIAGSEEAFARMMTERAVELGMANSHFVDSTGLPDPEQYMSPHDLAILAAHLIREYPDYYPYFAETSFTYGIKNPQPNRNPLLYLNMGADGLKTGHTEVSGFGLVGSAVREGRRLILVVNGLSSDQERSAESKRLMDLGFREFRLYEAFPAGAIVGEAEVWNGESATVRLKVADPVRIMMRREARRGLKVTYAYDGPISAPVSEGQIIGVLTVTVPDAQPVNVPVVAAENVERAGLIGRAVSAIGYLMLGE